MVKLHLLAFLLCWFGASHFVLAGIFDDDPKSEARDDLSSIDNSTTRLEVLDKAKREKLRCDVERLASTPRLSAKKSHTQRSSSLRCLSKMGKRGREWRSMVGAAMKAAGMNGFRVPGPGHVYEFGVFKGGSMRALHQLLKPAYIWGMDSFEGLPDYKTEQVKWWTAGQYKDDPRAALTKAFGKSRVGFVAGFYDKSLTPTLARERSMHPATYIDIDCDLYESSAVALDWVFRVGIAVPGTIIGYDDWWVMSCANGRGHPGDSGEGRAHKEIAKKYGVQFMCIAGPCLNGRTTRAKEIQENSPPGELCDPYDTWGPLFLIMAVGSEEHNTGFEMNEDDILDFRRVNKQCRQATTKEGGSVAEE